jgi:hypothetical protein
MPSRYSLPPFRLFAITSTVLALFVRDSVSITSSWRNSMNKPSVVVAVLCMLGSAAQPVSAAGCLKGAAVGGVAGHYAHHHAILGAIAGCAVGHHMAVKKEREQREEQLHQQQAHGAQGKY